MAAGLGAASCTLARRSNPSPRAWSGARAPPPPGGPARAPGGCGALGAAAAAAEGAGAASGPWSRARGAGVALRASALMGGPPAVAEAPPCTEAGAPP